MRGTGRRRTRAAAAACLLTAWVATTPAAAADRPRAYFGVRWGERIPGFSKATDIAGVTVGMDLDRLWGVEVAMDGYEYKVEPVSELSALTILPQGRLRAFSGTRWSPYLLAGVGALITQANDARTAVDWPGGRTAVHPVGSLGVGLEYFLADNVAAGVETKYLLGGDIAYVAEGSRRRFGLSTGLFSVGLRLLYPSTQPSAIRMPAVYFALRTGGAMLLDQTPVPGVRASAEQPVFGTDVGPSFGGSVGALFSERFGVEVSIDNYELALHLDKVGNLGEYAVFPIAFQWRYAWPRGPLTPYGLAGVGAELAQLNDRTPAGRQTPVEVHAKDVAIIGVFGAGLDWNLMHNVALTGEVRYALSRGHRFEIDGVLERANLDSLRVMVGVRVILLDS